MPEQLRQMAKLLEAEAGEAFQAGLVRTQRRHTPPRSSAGVPLAGRVHAGAQRGCWPHSCVAL